MASRLGAMASRLGAIASRLEDIATRLEAIASRMEVIGIEWVTIALVESLQKSGPNKLLEAATLPGWAYASQWPW